MQSASEAPYPPPLSAPPPALSVPPPWEERADRGFWLSLWRTWRASVFTPVAFFRSLPPGGGKGPALSYCVLVSAFGLFFALYWSTLETVLSGGLGPALGGEFDAVFSTEQQIILLVIGTGVGFVFSMLLNVAALFVGAALVHVGFALVGAGRQGFDATFRATAYSYGPVAFAIFPFYGGLATLIWGTVLLFIAMREVQRTTFLRAGAGFLLPGVALIVLSALASYFFFLLLSTADIGPPL